MQVANRDERIDSIKFYLIVLVIAGHVLSKLPPSPICVAVEKWIYIFHMPLFIFISGYFSRKKDSKAFWVSCWKLLEPLLWFQFITIGFTFISSGTISLKDALTPWWVLWYLLSLLYWRIFLQILPDKILSNSRLVIICAFSISLFAGFLPFNRFLSLQRTFSFLPFFLLGYYFRGRSFIVPTKFRLLSSVFLILTMIIPVFFADYLGDLTQADPYENPMQVLSRLFVFGLSIPMSMAFICICPNNSFAAKQGKFTMQYFIFHAFLISILLRFISSFNLPTSFFAAIIYTLAIVTIIGLIIQVPFISKLTNPSSLFLKLS